MAVQVCLKSVWGYSLVGRTNALQALSHRFESDYLQKIKLMKHLLVKDKKRRILYFIFEKRHVFLKSIIQNLSLPKVFRVQAYKQLLILPRDSSISRLRNRCIYTSRPRGIYRKFGLSRLMFRKYV